MYHFIVPIIAVIICVFILMLIWKDNEQKCFYWMMKKFLEKHAEKAGAVGTIIPVVYWLLIWQKINFSGFHFLFIVLLPPTIVMWIWVIYQEFKIRKEHPKQKSLFYLIWPIMFLLFSTISTIHIYYRWQNYLYITTT